MQILIADDDLSTRKLLEMRLKKWGYDVVSACDGNEAWEILQKNDAPRIALLDWIMPHMNGIELCEKIKKAEKMPFTFVIILTSKTNKEDIVKGLDAGADDYVIKPFDSNELKSRVAAGIRILKYDAELKKKNSQLACFASEMETLANERARQLVHSDRMATLGVMSAGIAHEINNPLTFISNNAQIVQKLLEKNEDSIREKLEQGGEEKKKLKVFIQELPISLEGISKGVARIKRIVGGLKGYARKSKGGRGLYDITQCIDEALEICHSSLKNLVTVEKHFDEDLPKIKVNSQEIEQVLINLFVNAAHAMESLKKGSIKISANLTNGFLRVFIEDSGPGIPEDKLEKIWESFYTSKTAGKGTGLGLSISKEIIKNHGGTIKAENVLNSGARFIIELPCD